MNVTKFISGKLRFRGKIVITSIALSFLVMIIAVAVSSGFRKELRDALSAATGDVRIVPSNLDWLSDATPISRDAAYLQEVESITGVKKVSPVVYRAGIVRNSDVVHGVMFKGVEDFSEAPDSVALAVNIPSRLSSLLSVSEGDSFQAYFIGERVRARKFRIVSVRDDLAETDDRLVVYCRMSDLQRVNGWDESQVSAFEVALEEAFRSESEMYRLSREIGAVTLLYASEDDESVVSLSSAEENARIFDWLSLIDFNVLFILVLMTIVAGFNMISGLLILLFENISTIGLLKALGMTNRAIAKVFLRSSSSLVLKGMAIGNALALLFCAVQSSTHFLRLDPENYFISYVPIHLNIFKILAADAAAYLIVMALLLLPSMFISKVDPAKTIKIS